jgi:dolichyl-phosphate-mannose-protein mannosyltransferase
MSSKKLNALILLGIMAFSIFTHFINLTYPSEVVFDEVHFGKFANSYISNTGYFDIHPPLGKLMLGLSAKIFNIEPACTFEAIGQSCDSYIFLALRFMPALFGVLTTFLFYLLTKELTKSAQKGLLAAFLFSLSNVFLLQSRHIQIDIFLVFFGILAIYLFLKALNSNKQWLFFATSALASGACLAVKWTGISFIAIIALLWFLKKFLKEIDLNKFILVCGIFLLGVISIYLLSFYVHFKIVPDNGEANPLLKENFQDLGFMEKISSINLLMFTANTNTHSTHPYQSKFYKWPFMYKKILYWKDYNSGLMIATEGNHVIWILSTVSMILAFISLCYEKLRKELYQDNKLLFLIIIGFAFGLLPFFFIHRSTYIYHYFPSYAFAIINLSVFIFWIKKYKPLAFWLIINLAIFGFIFSSAQTYGIEPVLPYRPTIETTLSQ